MPEESSACELCAPVDLLLESELAYVRYDSNSMSRGQARMHVHVHLIPRYAGDVADPRGGIRCVLAGKAGNA